MSTITANPPLRLIDNCVHCHSLIEATARFCGECGAPGDKARGARPHNIPAFAQTASHQPSAAPSTAHAFHQHGPSGGHHATNVTPISHGLHVAQQNAATHSRPSHSRSHTRAPQAVPSFAEFHNDVPQEMKDELGQLVVLLARERIFLLMHCSIFIIANLFGFWLAMTAYHEYVADELTKVLISLTPMMVINVLALACLSPIKGTKAEIARLKEKISYVRFQIDYRSFFKS